MKYYGCSFVLESDVAHYGLKGMHWGTRRWQDYSGKFNEAGYQRYFGRGTGQNYHRIKKGSYEKVQSTSNSINKGSSFDRDKAKKIAKSIAIGATVVGGTVLVAYGAKKVHDLGGISKVSQDVVAKARETKLENLKLKQEFKTEKAKIISDAKTELARIKEESTNNIKNVIDEAKLERRMDAIDPEGRIDRNILKANLLDQDLKARTVWERTMGSNTPKGLINIRMAESRKSINNDNIKLLKNLNDSDISLINSGKASLRDLKLDRSDLSQVGLKRHDSSTRIKSAAQNYNGGSRSSGAKFPASIPKTLNKSSLPKLTLTPDAINAGTDFLAQATKSYQAISQINSQNSTSQRRVRNGQKAVDDYTEELLRKSRV